MVNANGQQHSWTASQVKKSMESLGLSIPGKVTTGDVTYAANMAYADFYSDPLKDEAACLRYAHKVANDPDGYDGMIFCRWTADAIGKVIKLDWENLYSMLELIEAKDLEALMFFINVRVVIIIICWIFSTIACIVDFWSGTLTAKILGEKLMSHGFRRTVVKIGDYARVLMFAFMIDALGSLLSFYILPFATMLCTLAILCIEGKSVLENSKRRKAHAGDVPDMIKQIIQAATTEQGNEVFDKIVKHVSLNNKEK